MINSSGGVRLSRKYGVPGSSDFDSFYDQRRASSGRELSQRFRKKTAVARGKIERGPTVLKKGKIIAGVKGVAEETKQWRPVSLAKENLIYTVRRLNKKGKLKREALAEKAMMEKKEIEFLAGDVANLSPEGFPEKEVENVPDLPI